MAESDGNALYCLLEARLLEHGERDGCPSGCPMLEPCQDLWSGISERADNLTQKQYDAYQRVFQFVFENIASAGYQVSPNLNTKTPWAVRLGRMGQQAQSETATHADYVAWGKQGAEARWGKRWVWK